MAGTPETTVGRCSSVPWCLAVPARDLPINGARCSIPAPDDELLPRAIPRLDA